MIKIYDKTIVLETKSTSYIMYADEIGNLFHLYYGQKLWNSDDSEAMGQLVKALLPSFVNPIGTCVIADPANPTLSLDDRLLEISTRGKGDLKDPFVEIIYPDGSRTSDFRFESAVVTEKKQQPEGLPGAYFLENEAGNDSSLLVTLKDVNSNLRLELVYSVFEDCDCITRFARLVNPAAGSAVGSESGKSAENTEVSDDTAENSAASTAMVVIDAGHDISVANHAAAGTFTVTRLMSAQLDLPADTLKITSFHGDWIREMNRFDTLLQAGRFVNESNTGYSSNKANPFVMYAAPETTEEYGDCYATNLIWSGSHTESAEIGSHGNSRILTGMNPGFTEWKLEEGTSFTSPEAVMCYSHDGYDGISRCMHRFVREHIVRGNWQKKERPVLINSWEAMYFKMTEKKLLKLADHAKQAGIELFVMDDGWFGRRNDEHTSLGDWVDNTEKLPNGISGLSAKIKAKGLLFGIWVEPEMVNEDSDLYRAHPDWAVQIPGKPHSLGRYQYVLDLSREDVQNYIIDSMTAVFSRCNADYVKWDLNRNISDHYSNGLSPERQGEFDYRYMLGLYHVFDVLTKRFPDTLFEGCASGGNRFDLGVLCYFPQIWASDCTDAMCRCRIQNGYSYGYPQSVLGAHVSSVPNHQTLRETPLETRFAVASAGVLGYELNLSDAPSATLAAISEEVALYKKWRKTLQYGDFYRLKAAPECAIGGLSMAHMPGALDTEEVQWMIVAPDQSEAVAITVRNQAKPNVHKRSLHCKGLDEQTIYHVYNCPHKVDIHRMGDLINTAVPVHIKQDSMLHNLAAKFVKLDGDQEDITVSGSVLNRAGICLSQNYAGTGFGANTAVYQDYEARMYFMEKAEDGEA